MDDKRDEVYTQAEKTEAWTGAARMVETYSEEMIKRWKEEIDTYLVFVRDKATHTLTIIRLTQRRTQGGTILGRPHNIQRAVVSATPTSHARSLDRRLAADLFATRKLVGRLPTSQHHSVI